MHVDDVVDVNLHFWDQPKTGIYNVGTGRAQSFNDVALTVVNSLREAAGQSALSLADAARERLIEYIAFPQNLRGKYQAFTQADLTALRAAGCAVAFRPVEQGTSDYMKWLLAS